MPEIKLTQEMHRVDIYEYERGWGSKLDEKKYFDTKEEAEAFVVVYNSRNTAKTAPDWYMQAKYWGKV